MSLPRVAALLASLFFFSAFAVAKVSAPSCTTSAFQWAFNSLGQSPCTVAAYMMATCNGGDFTLSPLNAGGSYYNANTTFASCECTTVGYSLISACGACQGETWYNWLEWADQCTATPPPSTFPNPVPSGIRVPQWALFDVTVEGNWDPSTAYAVGDFPEIGPGSILGPSGVSTPPISSSTATGLPISGGGSSKVGAIAGGIVGGIAAFAIVIAAIFYLRRNSQAPSAGVGAPQPLRPLSVEGVPSSPTTIKSYHPNNPTTFPYQGGPHSHEIPYQGPMSLYDGTGNSLGHTQTSLPRARGYDGRPIL